MSSGGFWLFIGCLVASSWPDLTTARGDHTCEAISYVQPAVIQAGCELDGAATMCLMKQWQRCNDHDDACTCGLPVQLLSCTSVTCFAQGRAQHGPAVRYSRGVCYRVPLAILQVEPPAPSNRVAMKRPLVHRPLHVVFVVLLLCAHWAGLSLRVAVCRSGRATHVTVGW